LSDDSFTAIITRVGAEESAIAAHARFSIAPAAFLGKKKRSLGEILSTGQKAGPRYFFLFFISPQFC
jgi:hypothetical protein